MSNISSGVDVPPDTRQLLPGTAGWGTPNKWVTPPGVATGATPPGNPRNPKKTDPRHPKIKQLMDPYLKRYNGYVDLGEILTSSGKCMSDLPTLPQYCSARGESLICWNTVSGFKKPPGIKNHSLN
jgi:hypothetical protein